MDTSSSQCNDIGDEILLRRETTEVKITYAANAMKKERGNSNTNDDRLGVDDF